jgi:hypothetical protein
MNVFNAEIWDPGLLAKDKSNHTRQKSIKGNGAESDLSAASSDDEDGHKKGGKPPSVQRKISFSKESFGFIRR